MMIPSKYLLLPDHQYRDKVLANIHASVNALDPTKPWRIEITRHRKTRSLEQNDHIHPLVRIIKNHMEQHGAPKRHETWWRYYMLGKYKGQEMVPDPDGSGGFVVINTTLGTSCLKKHQAAEFIEFLYAFGDQVGVNWPEALDEDNNVKF